MIVEKVPVSDTDRLRKILTIHDQMPREWDPTHEPSADFIEKLIGELQTTDQVQGFWVLQSAVESPIKGILWAGIKTTGRDTRSCVIKSIWLDSQFRKQSFSRLLTGACLEWGSAQGATLLTCDTHFENQRMREILEKNGFSAGMVSYSKSFV